MGFSHLLRVPQDNRPEGPSRCPSRAPVAFLPIRQQAHVFTLAADCGRCLGFCFGFDSIGLVLDTVRCGPMLAAISKG